MSEQKWTKEPWRRCGGVTPAFIAIAGADDVLVIDGMADRDQMEVDGYSRSSAPDMETQGANASRIVACVNGCRGINPEGVADAIACLEKWLSYADMNKRTYQTKAGDDVPLVRATRAALAKARASNGDPTEGGE